MTLLAIVALVLLSLAGAFAIGKKWAHATGHPVLEAELELAREALGVVGEVIQGHEHGLAWSEALLAGARSTEAQDLLQRVLTTKKDDDPPAPPPSSSSSLNGAAPVIVFALVLGGASLGLAGCSHTVDATKAAALDDEIATLTSLALANPGLTPEQTKRIQDAGAKVRANAKELEGQ